MEIEKHTFGKKVTKNDYAFVITAHECYEDLFKTDYIR